MMLPVPTVPEMAAENASNCETEFLPRFLPFLPLMPFTAGTMVEPIDSPNFRTCKNFVRTVSSRPTPRIIMTIGQPHTTPLTKSFTFVTASIKASHIKIASQNKNGNKKEPNAKRRLRIKRIKRGTTRVKNASVLLPERLTAKTQPCTFGIRYRISPERYPHTVSPRLRYLRVLLLRERYKP